TDVTGEQEHERLDEIEVIFGNFEQIDPQALRRCWNLQRFTLINCKLNRINGLEPVGASLVHLNLSDQHITRIEELGALVNLRFLYLQNNRIEKIEGLEHCRKLQRLWLYNNCITQVQNLGFCTDLRELWLQDNRIRGLGTEDGTGITNLVNLQTLHLASNRIRDIEEFQVTSTPIQSTTRDRFFSLTHRLCTQHARKAISLQVLSFYDDHFGSNPIVNHPEYRSFAIATLKSLRQLDGITIAKSERTGAEDQFLAQTLAFNDKIAELTLVYETELRTINGRKERGLSNAQMLQRELVEALNEIEDCVKDGQQQIDVERQRQQRLREQHTAIFKQNIEVLQHEFHDRIDRQLELETQRFRAEEITYEIMEQEAIAEQRHACILTTLQCTFPSQIAFQHLPSHSADHRYIASHFNVANEYDDASSTIQILQMHRFFHQDLVAAFEESTSVDMRNGSSFDPTGEGTELYLYLVTKNEDEVTQYLQSGVSGSIGTNNSSKTATDETIDDWLYLFSNPLQALAFYEGTPGKILPDDEDDEDEPREVRIATFQVLLCRVRMHQTIELFYPEKSYLTSLKVLHAVATPSGSILQPPPTAFLQLELGGSSTIIESNDDASRCGHVYLARKAKVGNHILPQFLLLCSKRLQHIDGCDEVSNGTDVLEPRATNVQSSSSSTAVLIEFQHALQSEVQAYHQRLYDEMDPYQVRFRAQLLEQKQQLDDRLQQQRAQIEREKRTQEQLVRSLKADQRRC
uniref:Uncharacterized protein n=1 Tax=Globisporangium ultimum (strain ATCC 200006 / CBS 805.95 / DAOM BR144) TaxID=431595 RepID=K3X653_GLOUD